MNKAVFERGHSDNNQQYYQAGNQNFLFLKHNMIIAKSRASAALRAWVRMLSVHSGNKDISEIILICKLLFVII